MNLLLIEKQKRLIEIREDQITALLLEIKRIKDENINSNINWDKDKKKWN